MLWFLLPRCVLFYMYDSIRSSNGAMQQKCWLGSQADTLRPLRKDNTWQPPIAELAIRLHLLPKNQIVVHLSTPGLRPPFQAHANLQSFLIAPLRLTGQHVNHM
jgi:hypothetical protein